MAYITSADITARMPDRIIVQLTDDEKTTTSTVLATAITENASITARIDAAIADAQTAVDTYVRSRHSVPLATTPASIVKACSDIAIFNLFSRRPEFETPEDIDRRYRDAMRLLEGINKGTIDLGIEPTAAASVKVVADAKSTEAAFTSDAFGDY